MNASQVKKALSFYADPDKAIFLQRFFRTAKGEYAEGDFFIGITVPVTRKVASRFLDLTLPEVQKLLKSRIHEERLLALIILVKRFAKSNLEQQAALYRFYLSHTKHINNWDLVDLSAPHIVGAYLYSQSAAQRREILDRLARSTALWERRIAVLSCFYFIKKGDAKDLLRLAKLLLQDKHDLIHKAVGWMLREVGKRVDELLLIDFLEQHYKKMPRAMLRYSLEHLSPKLKAKFMVKDR